MMNSNFKIMKTLANKKLIQKAKSVTKPKKIRHGYTVGDVGSALVTNKGNIFLGVCIDITSGIGFCAEHSAIASMVTNGEYKIRKIVAVTNQGVVIPPCGRCREFIRQIDDRNINTEVIIGRDKSIKLKELLPFPYD